MNKYNKNLIQGLVNYILENEETSYEEYMWENFPEIDEDMYFDIETYTREDNNHIFTFALEVRDYLLEDVTYELGT